jgi:hypothetical protein
VQAFVRLSQAVHALADTISNWDVIVDCFVQIIYIITNQRASISDDVTPHELDKVFMAIHRFQEYSVFLSEESLVRLTTALVCLSMHTVEVSTVTPDAQLRSPAGAAAGAGAAPGEQGRGSGRLGAPLLSSVSGAAKEAVQRLVSNPDGGGERERERGGNSRQQMQQQSAPGGNSDGGGGMGGMGGGRNMSHYWSRAPPYLADALSSGAISYALYAIIDLVKANTFRLACVWNMVSSHLRAVAMSKNGNIRALAVAATNDLISTALQHMKQQQQEQQGQGQAGSGSGAGVSAGAQMRFCEDPVWTPPPFPAVGAGGLIQAPLNLTVLVDDLLFNFLLPPFEKVYVPLMYQRSELAESKEDCASKPKLAQSELLLSLKALASVPQADVRNDSIHGLLALLQEGGHAVEGGWEIVFDLLMSIPLSMTAAGAGAAGAGARGKAVSAAPSTPGPASAGSEGSGSGSGSGAGAGMSWPKESLLSAFTCMKLVVDDFLEELPHEVIIKAVHCVAAFSAQGEDVNVSLTSIEMLWKVTDYIMTSSRERERELGDQDTSTAALDVMFDRLSHLSVDSRPEIRNCATNTLFSAVLSNAGSMSPEQWRSVFDDIVFPLFEATEQKSLLAMSSKEEAMTTELKKGVKMALHHSRDTAHKQWLETRVLALRGTCRAIKAGARNLSLEPWFEHTWGRALGACLSSLQAKAGSVDTGDLEVCVASVDMLFDMVKMVATRAYRSKARAGFGMRVVGGALVSEEANIARTPAEMKAAAAAALSPGDQDRDREKGELDGLTEVAREKLWQSAWGAVRACVCYERIGSDLALHICQQLRDLYSGGVDGEFRYSQNVKSLLELVACLARPRTGISLPPPGAESAPAADATEGGRAAAAFAVDAAAVTNVVKLNAKMNKIADAQLVRGVMTLLRTIAPVDIVAFSALMTTLAELAFGRSCVEMSYSVASNSAKADGGARRCIVLGPVDAKLRWEVGEYIVAILSARERERERERDKDKDKEGDGSSAGGDSGGGCGGSALPAVFLDTPASWLGVCLEVVVRNFVSELCIRPSLRRANLVGVSSPAGGVGGKGGSEGGSASPGKGGKAQSPRSNSIGAGGGIGGFFSSIGKMLTSTLESEDDDSSESGSEDADSAAASAAAAAAVGAASAANANAHANAMSAVAAAAFRDNMMHTAAAASAGTLSALREDAGPVCDALCGGAGADVPGLALSAWKPFRTTPTDLKILHLLFRLGLRPALISAPPATAAATTAAAAAKGGSSDSKKLSPAPQVLSHKQQCVWSHVLTSVLCILSPWREVELVSSRGQGQGQGQGQDAVSPSVAGAAAADDNKDGISLASDVISAVGAVVTFLIDSR